MSGKWISGPAAILILLLFFLPWIMVSCNGQPIGQLSGFELATGSNRDLPVDPNLQLLPAASGGDTAWLFIPLMALLTIGVLALDFWRPQWRLFAGLGQGGAALWGLLILLLEWRLFQGAQNEIFEITIMPALWGTAVAFLLILVGGGVDVLLAMGRRAAPVAAPAAVPQWDTPSPWAASREAAPQPAAPQPAMPPPVAAPFAPFTDPGATLADAQEADAYAAEIKVPRVDDEGFFDDLPAKLPGTAPLVEERLWGETAVEPEDAALQWNPPTPMAPPPATPQLPLAWLVIREGPKAGEQYRLQAITRIGRAPENEIVLADTAVSSSHGLVAFANGQFYYEDQGSTNGSLVFNQDTQQWQRADRVPLNDGAQIKLGRTVLHFMSV